MSVPQTSSPDALRWDTKARIVQFDTQLVRLKEQYRQLPVTDIAGSACLQDTMEALIRRRTTREVMLSNLQGREGIVSLAIVSNPTLINLDD